MSAPSGSSGSTKSNWSSTPPNLLQGPTWGRPILLQAGGSSTFKSDHTCLSRCHNRTVQLARRCHTKALVFFSNSDPLSTSHPQKQVPQKAQRDWQKTWKPPNTPSSTFCTKDVTISAGTFQAKVSTGPWKTQFWKGLLTKAIFYSQLLVFEQFVIQHIDKKSGQLQLRYTYVLNCAIAIMNLLFLFIPPHFVLFILFIYEMLFIYCFCCW